MLNICGCLVHAMPGKAEAVMAAINATEGGEVHAHDEGRIVVTVEDTAFCRRSGIDANTMPPFRQIYVLFALDTKNPNAGQR